MIVLYYGVLIACVLYNKYLAFINYQGEARHRIVGIVLLLAPILLIIQPYHGEIKISMIDVGQGDCFFIEGPEGGTYLVDGGSSDCFSVGKYRIESYLQSIGVDTLDYVLVSHGDIDHLSGVEELLKNQTLGIKIKTLVLCRDKFWDEKIRSLAALAYENGTDIMMIHTQDTISEGKMTITCLAPLAEQDLEIGNASSMVLDINYGTFDMLFTGDVEGKGEELLTEYLKTSEKSYEILKVAHHGSKNSTSDQFLMTSPLKDTKIALISAGVDSAYGHPHQETIQRLLNHGCKIYQTPLNGGVFLSYYEKSDTIIIDKMF